MSERDLLLSGDLGWESFRAARRRFLARPAASATTTEDIMVLDRFIDAWNARDAEALAASFTPDGVRHQFTIPEARLAGREAIAEAMGAIIHAVPDARLDVRSRVEGDDGTVTMEWTFRGTHENDFPGLPAKGGRVELPGVSVCRISDDDLIAEERVYWDGAILMEAAGLLG